MTDTTQSERFGEIWILGASGRIGSAVTANLTAQGFKPILVGRERDGDRLGKTAANFGSRVVIADGVDSIVAEIIRQRPAVVFNGIGNYAESASIIARACMSGGGHYLDLAADLIAVPRLLDLHQEAKRAGSTLVTGSGFGVLATEAVVIKLCEHSAPPVSVHVDALASVSLSAGVVGSAFAASIIDMFATGGRCYTDGRLVTSRLGAGLQNLTLPDGQQAKSAEAPTAELLAAQRASHAPSVTATTGTAPISRVARTVAPLVGKLLSIKLLRRFVLGQLAKARMKEIPSPRRYSWGHAVITWPDGRRREGWLRADDGMVYTASVAALVAANLARGDGRPGAYTPGALFGTSLAEQAGGKFLLNNTHFSNPGGTPMD
ncbi:saccharopine dehydrogenase NADP-binding domain-containing protein [Serratia rubidaea]|uniref:saccharopine dehydrogenase NADP-binding domain-containing protein n=1 Tax=Serratia rubidaea TaxID=61652 RepID=UPI00242E7D94|nr:saccharopine dehydrogenase NADP-binding domain-containing protein [Serratia rubidaea]MCR1000624.1 saccharopine dehydrogenase NADP-binding domain-containing protein [Serratia rubidaea]